MDSWHDAGGAEAESPSIQWQGYHLRPRTAQNPRPAMPPRTPAFTPTVQAAVDEAEMEASASLGPIKKRLKVCHASGIVQAL